MIMLMSFPYFRVCRKAYAFEIFFMHRKVRAKSSKTKILLMKTFTETVKSFRNFKCWVYKKYLLDISITRICQWVEVWGDNI